MFFKAVQHIWKSVFSILWYWGLKSLIPDNPSLLWSSCSQAGWGILHWEKKSSSLITYCPGKVYWTILHCRLWRISRNALTRVKESVPFLVAIIQASFAVIFPEVRNEKGTDSRVVAISKLPHPAPTWVHAAHGLDWFSPKFLLLPDLTHSGLLSAEEPVEQNHLRMTWAALFSHIAAWLPGRLERLSSDQRDLGMPVN